MENFKRKPLKFSGFAREVRVVEMNAARKFRRSERHSTARQIEVEESPNEKVISKIPTFGNKKPHPAREEMLKRWKEQKELKKEIDKKSRKPVFKLGVAAPCSLMPVSTLKLEKSRIQVSDATKSQTASSAVKIIKKDPHLQVSNIQSQAIGITKPKPQAEKSKFGSSISSHNTKPPINTATKENKNKMPSSAVPKIASLKPSRNIQIPLASKPKAPATLTNKSNLQNSSNKFNKPAVKIPNSSQAKSTGLGKASKSKLDRLQAKTVSGNSSVSEKNVTFRCQLSCIEPVEKQEKSFAPLDFEFHAISGLQTSWILKDGPSAIFEQLIGEEQSRTSTPKRSDWKIPTSEKEDLYTSESIPSSDTKVIQCLLDSVTSSDATNVDCLPDPSFSGVKLPESTIPIIQPEKRDNVSNVSPRDKSLKVSPEINSLNHKQFKPVSSEVGSDEIPQQDLDTCKENFFEPEQSLKVLSKVTSTDSEINCQSASTEMDSSKTKTAETVIACDSPGVSLPIMDQEACSFLTNSVLPSLSNGAEIDNRLIKTRSFCRRSEKPGLLKIDECPEDKDTPKSSLKKQKKKVVDAALGEITPRRSARIAARYSCDEYICDIKESLIESSVSGSEEEPEVILPTHDFERLHLQSDSVEPTYSMSSITVRPRKVSLLYTPPNKGRVSTLRKGVQDLMIFSPNS